MDSIGPDLWQIIIEPYSYYGLPPGTSLNGIFMVFRNADGTLTGKNDINDDIFVDLTTDPPSSAFGGISSYWIKDGVDFISWSDGSEGNSLSVDSSGVYWVNVTDTTGCVATDSIFVEFLTLPTPDLGLDTSLCDTPFTITLDAGAGFSTYAWSDGSSGSTTTAITFATYSVTVTNAGGCEGSDTVAILSGITIGSIFLGNDTAICGIGSIVLDAGVQLSPEGDSLVITYDASQGVTELVGAAKVVFAFWG